MALASRNGKFGIPRFETMFNSVSVQTVTTDVLAFRARSKVVIRKLRCTQIWRFETMQTVLLIFDHKT